MKSALLVAGLGVVAKRCPLCGGPMFIKKACCGWKKSGWKRVLRCLRAGCPHMEGYDENRRDNG